MQLDLFQSGFILARGRFVFEKLALLEKTDGSLRRISSGYCMLVGYSCLL